MCLETLKDSEKCFGFRFRLHVRKFDQGIRLRIDSVKIGYDRLERLSPVIKVVIRLHPSVVELARS